MRKLNKGILATIVLLIMMMCTFYMFSSYVNTMTNESIGSQLIEITKNDARMVSVTIERDKKQLHGIADRIANTANIEDMAQTQKLLQSSITYSSFSHLIIFTKDHIVYDETSDLTSSITTNFEEVRNTTMYAFQTPHIQQGIAINIPIEKDGEIVGVVSGAYYEEAIMKHFNDTVFEGKGYYGILDKAGTIVLSSEKFHEDDASTSLFKALKNAKFYKSYSLSEMKKNMQEDKSFYTSYQTDGKQRYAYLMPLGISDWYIMSAVPAEILTMYKTGIDTAILCLMIWLSILFLILLYINLRLSRRTQKELKNDHEMMERLIHTIPMPIIMTDCNRNIIQMNKPAMEAFQQFKGCVLGKPCSCLQMDVCGTKQCSIERYVREGIHSITVNCEGLQYLVTTTKMTNHKGEWIGFVETFQNITEIMENKHVLEMRTLELEMISENLSAGLLITSLEEGFSIIQCNTAYLDLIEDQEENVIGKPAMQWLLKANASDISNTIMQQLHEKNEVYLEHLLKRKNGDKIWVSLSGKQGELHGKKVGIWILVNIHERKLIDNSNRINEERYRVALENIEDIIIDYDILQDELFHNEKIREVYDVDLFVKHPLEYILGVGIIAEESVADFKMLFKKLRQGETKIVLDLKTITKQGEALWVHTIFTTIFDDQHQPVRAIGVMHDCTAEKTALMKYEKELKYRKVTTEDAALCYEVDLNTLLFLNGHENLVKKYASGPTRDYNTIVGFMLDYLVYENDRDIVYRHTRPDFIHEQYRAGASKIEFQYRRILGHGECSWVQCTIHIFEDESSKHLHMIGYIKDIEKAKKLEFHLKQLAQQDLLTGVYNKITTQLKIDKRLSTLLEQADILGALAIIDLDDFKNINDSFGHAFGDAVLFEVSQRLKKLCMDKDIVGRIGGDEFIVYFPGLSSIEEVIEKANSICAMFREAYTGNNKNYKLSGSIGVSIAPRDGHSFDELYKRADIALYFVKSSGKDRYCIYDETLPPIGSNRVTQRIDENAGKQLSDNVSEYVLRILYEEKEPRLVLNAVLELVARRFSYSRGYVFQRCKEKNCWKNINEWCADGIPSQIENMNHVKFGDDGYYEQLFNDAGEFIYSDVKDLDRQMYEKIEVLHIKAFAQIAIKRHNEIIAFVGFDNCWHNSKPTDEELKTLHIITMLIDAFIFR